jgi:hypothetical protein
VEVKQLAAHSLNTMHDFNKKEHEQLGGHEHAHGSNCSSMMLVTRAGSC